MTQGQRSMPILPATDLAVAVSFYTDALGFRLAGILPDDNGKDRFAIVQMDRITIGLQASERAGSGDEWAGYFYLADIAAFADQIQGNGVRVLRGPENTYYHCTELDLRDPTGNLLCFAQDNRPGPDGPGL